MLLKISFLFSFLNEGKLRISSIYCLISGSVFQCMEWLTLSLNTKKSKFLNFYKCLEEWLNFFLWCHLLLSFSWILFCSWIQLEFSLPKFGRPMQLGMTWGSSTGNPEVPPSEETFCLLFKEQTPASLKCKGFYSLDVCFDSFNLYDLLEESVYSQDTNFPNFLTVPRFSVYFCLLAGC